MAAKERAEALKARVAAAALAAEQKVLKDEQDRLKQEADDFREMEECFAGRLALAEEERREMLRLETEVIQEAQKITDDANLTKQKRLLAEAERYRLDSRAHSHK